jgi:GNAT superfamily N-acetyltransferase
MSETGNSAPRPRFRPRAGSASDAAFLVEMARHACVIEDWPLPDPDSKDVTSILPSSDDVAIIATDAAGVMFGAAWTFFHDPPLLFGTNGIALPEIAIAVIPRVRGHGVGGELLNELAARCAGTFEALSLNVHQRNPATHLYERNGFRIQCQGRGALGIAMLKYLR